MTKPVTYVKVEFRSVDGTARTIELFGNESEPLRFQLGVENDVREKPQVDPGPWAEYEATGYASVSLEAFGRLKGEQQPLCNCIDARTLGSLEPQLVRGPQECLVHHESPADGVARPG